MLPVALSSGKTGRYLWTVWRFAGLSIANFIKSLSTLLVYQGGPATTSGVAYVQTR
jgi:hypothetical protein